MLDPIMNDVCQKVAFPIQLTLFIGTTCTGRAGMMFLQAWYLMFMVAQVACFCIPVASYWWQYLEQIHSYDTNGAGQVKHEPSVLK